MPTDTAPATVPIGDKLALTYREVCQFVGLSRRTIVRLEAQEKLARLVEAAEAMLTSYDSSPVVLRRVEALREAIAAAKEGA